MPKKQAYPMWTSNDIKLFKNLIVNRELNIENQKSLEDDWPIDICKVLVKKEDTEVSLLENMEVS